MDLFFFLKQQQQFELLFCFHTDDDPAIQVVERLHERYPHVDRKIFIGETEHHLIRSKPVCSFWWSYIPKVLNLCNKVLVSLILNIFCWLLIIVQHNFYSKQMSTWRLCTVTDKVLFYQYLNLIMNQYMKKILRNLLNIHKNWLKLTKNVGISDFCMRPLII